MIKNLVFDMGGVLLKFDTDLFIERVGVKDLEDKKLLTREIYKSVEWAMMDRGTLTDEDAYEIIQKRVPDRLKGCVRKLTCEWDRPIVPIEGMSDLVKEYKEKGYKIYLLSNASVNQNNYWHNIPGSEYFDGTVVSSYIKLIKPQPEIYKHLLDKFNLEAKETVLIDDAIQNVESAIFCGLNGIVFHGDVNELKEKLNIMIEEKKAL